MGLAGWGRTERCYGYGSRLRVGGVLLVVLAVMIGVGGGCASKVREVKVPVSLPSEFSSSGQEAPVEQWWRSFNDPGLDKLIEKALGSNFDLKIAWDRMAQAEAVAKRTGADLKPRVDLSGSARRTRERTGGNTEYTNRYLLGLPASYEIDLWGRINSQQQAALLDLEASKEDVTTAAITLTARIAQTWYRLIEARQQVKVISDQNDINVEVLTSIKGRFGQGQTGAADVMRQKQFVVSGLGQLILANESVESLRHELALLLALPPNSSYVDIEGSMIELPSLPSIPLPAALIQRRPDVVRAYRKVQAADRRAAVAIKDQFPKISLSSNLETTGARTRDLFDNWLASLTANLAQPLFEGGRLRAEVDRTKAVLSETINTYGQVVLTSLKEVEDALKQERRQAEYVKNLSEQIVAAELVQEVTRINYDQGQFDYIRMLDALTSLQSLQRNDLTARRQLIELRIDLCRAIAGGWEMERPEPAKVEAEDKGEEK